MLALEGTKVIDLTRNPPGQFCTMVLADLGADVVKIEEHGRVTGRRAEQAKSAVEVGPEVRTVVDVYSPYNALARNKRSVALNLKMDEGREVFYELARGFDVVVEGFRPGVTKRLGIDYDKLKGMNGRLVYCAVTGYGQTGPYRNLAGHDINFIAQAGAMSLIGQPGVIPAIPGNLLADFAGGGMQAVVGIMAALLARQKTGRGQFVDISMTDGVVLLMAQTLSWYFSSGQVPERGTHVSTGIFPHYNVYETKDKRYVTIGATEPYFFTNLCKAIGREDLIPFQYDVTKRQELFTILRQTFKTRTRDEWFELLTQSDICVGKVQRFDELASDPQLRQRNMILEVEHPTAGKIKQLGISVKLSDTPGAIRRLAPACGEHTEEVLNDLGYDGTKIARLREMGVIPGR